MRNRHRPGLQMALTSFLKIGERRSILDMPQSRILPWRPEVTAEPTAHAVLRPSESTAPVAASRKLDDDRDSDGLSDADLPFLPMEQYTSVWEAILAHL